MRRSIAASYPAHSLPTSALSLLVHALFLALLVFGMEWQNHPPKPVQAELWSGIPPLAKQTPVVPDMPEPVESPPEPEPPAPPPEKVSIKPPAPTPPAPAPLPKPDIATDRAKQAKESAAQKAEQELREIERKKEQQDAKLREIEKTQKEKEKREAALKEQALKAQALKEQAEEKRLADLQREADARSALAQASNNQQVLQTYIERIQAKIKSNTIVPPSVPSGVTLSVKFVVLPDGSVLEGSIKVIQSSGQSAYDDAVQRAIIASQPLPLPEDLALRRQMRDVSLKTTNR
jgi:colicin import membrane protein